jgi:hypothetical protein
MSEPKSPTTRVIQPTVSSFMTESMDSVKAEKKPSPLVSDQGPSEQGFERPPRDEREEKYRRRGDQTDEAGVVLQDAPRFQGAKDERTRNA